MAVKRAETDDGLLLSRVDDAFDAVSRQRARFLSFLDQREQALVTRHAAAREDAVLFFWGGYADAERRMPGVFPRRVPPDGAVFPITAVRICWKGNEELTHRDFLGALLSLGLKREKVGDIVVRHDDCIVLMEHAVASFALSNLSRVGRVGVSCSEFEGELCREERFADISDTVASARLDCVVSALAGLSRAQAGKWIAGGLVAVDFLPVSDTAHRVAPGAALSIRGCGRFLVDEVGPPTRKGRLRLAARKYL